MSWRALSRRLSAVLMCALTQLSLGCGDTERQAETQPVSGRLLINGQPAKDAMVVFHPVSGQSFDDRGTRPKGYVDEQGNFSVYTYEAGDGAPVGEYNVCVLWLENPRSPDPGVERLGGQFARPSQAAANVTIVNGENQLDAIELNGIKLVGQRGTRQSSPVTGPPDRG